MLIFKAHRQNLKCTNIGVDGAKALAAVLKDSQLTKLKLWFNQIGVDGAKALAAALKDSQLTELDLAGTKIDENIQKQVEQEITSLRDTHRKFGT